jgi:6-phosphogluconolactonase (cycloisomerase 2 family)
VTGALTVVPGSPFLAGRNARSVTVDPTGAFAYVGNWGSSDVSAYTINATTGALTAVTGSPFAGGYAPSAVAVDPSGKYVLAANYWSDDVSVFVINAATGALSELSASPYLTVEEGHPSAIAVIRIAQ